MDASLTELGTISFPMSTTVRHRTVAIDASFVAGDTLKIVQVPMDRPPVAGWLAGEIVLAPAA